MTDAARPSEAAHENGDGEGLGVARSGPATELAPPAAGLRSHLPGLEPERRVTDWGRSERVEAAVDRTVSEFLYHHWFRVEVEAIENVPAAGGALLLANHAGLLPPDGIMIAKAIREEHPRPRPVSIAVSGTLRGVPGIGSLVTKAGGVAAHPADVRRLLADEEGLLLHFPEGSDGSRKALGERYRLRRFDTRLLAAALGAGVPVVPVAVIGAEEAQPVLARVPLLHRLPLVPRLRLTAPLPLPAKFRIRFLEPVRLEGDGVALDDSLVGALAEDIRALVQENLLEMVAARRSVWLG